MRRRTNRIIRPATKEDISAVRTCAEQAYTKYVERMGKIPAPMAADFDAIQEDGSLHVIENDRCVVGYIVFYPVNQAMHLENVAVLPRAKGKGYGSRLITFAEETARAQGFRHMELYTNANMTENFAYYEGKGYTEIGRWKDDGFDRVFYRKSL